ncbi:hypothetical protein ES708_00645 [subsurface metagenome]
MRGNGLEIVSLVRAGSAPQTRTNMGQPKDAASSIAFLLSSIAFSLFPEDMEGKNPPRTNETISRPLPLNNSPVFIISLPSRVSLHTDIPFTPAFEKFSAASSIFQGFVVMVWIQSFEKSVSLPVFTAHS